MRGSWLAGTTGVWQSGQWAIRWVCEPAVRSSGENKVRVCLGWPGCPPPWRGEEPRVAGSLLGLTMSELGGLEEVEESLLLAASFSLSWRISSANAAIACCCCCSCCCSVCTSWCIRSQLPQVFALVWHIPVLLLTVCPTGYTPPWPDTPGQEQNSAEEAE